MKDFNIKFKCENFYTIPRAVVECDKEYYGKLKKMGAYFFNYAEGALKKALKQMPVVGAAVFRFEIICSLIGSQYTLYYSPEDTEIKNRLAILLASFLKNYKVNSVMNGAKKIGVPAFKVSYIYDENTTASDGFHFRVNPEIAEFEEEIKKMAIRAFPAWFETYKED